MLLQFWDWAILSLKHTEMDKGKDGFITLHMIFFSDLRGQRVGFISPNWLKQKMASADY